MKLFRLRFILLGLLLCLCHVWCLTCGTEFDDTASSAYLADVVVIGTVTQKFPSVDDLFTATITISKSRNVLKGERLLRNKKLLARRGSSLITIGKFGKHSPEYCSAIIERDEEYIFFLNGTKEGKYFKLSALPLSAKNNKIYKRARKSIKKILCKKSTCVKLPAFSTKKKMKDSTIQEGKKIELNCRLKTKPLPNAVFTWLKDGKDINTLKIRGLRIKTTKKNSRLTIRKAVPGNKGTYMCIARNVGGDIRQEAVINVVGESTSRPEAGIPEMRNKNQTFGGTLRLTCKTNSKTNPETKFTWMKDGKEIISGDKDGLTINSKGFESKLRKKKTLLTDEGVYTCIAKNDAGVLIQQSNVTVTNAPQKEVPCGEKEADYCLNGGVCRKYVELNKIFCTCPRDYRGRRCEIFSIDDVRRLAEERMLAQDRTIVVVGIISGILLFIGICVASYFLAKRRRDRFHRRRRQRANGNIEDNIPQVYRPLIGCDNIDGLTKKMNGVLIHKETQTTETCFLGVDKTNLYINPLEGYTRNDGGDGNSRSRKDAVSLDDEPRRRTSQNNDQNNTVANKPDNRTNNPGEHKYPDNKGDSIGQNLNLDGGPGGMLNDLSPRHNPIQKETEKPVGAIPQVANIPSPKSNRPPAINLDTDSDEEVPGDGTPLTPLHISEDEDNSELFKKCKPKRTDEEKAEIFKKCKLKATALQAFAPLKKQENVLKSNPKEINMSLPVNSPENNTAVSTNGQTDTAEKHSNANFSANDDSDASSSTTEGCDSPNTAFANSQDFAETSPTPARTWNERGSPEPSAKTGPPPPTYYQAMYPDKHRKGPYADKGHRHPSDKRDEDGRNNKLRTHIKDKFSIAI